MVDDRTRDGMSAQAPSPSRRRQIAPITLPALLSLCRSLGKNVAGSRMRQPARSRKAVGSSASNERKYILRSRCRNMYTHKADNTSQNIP